MRQPLHSIACLFSRLRSKTLGTALLITFLQIGSAWMLSGYEYGRFNQWDSMWYRNIVDAGYHSTLPPAPQAPDLANVAFFPGYPLLVSLAKILFGLNTFQALLLVAQFCAFCFWIYYLLFLRQIGLQERSTTAAILLMALQPGAFFLIMGYSESLFLAASFGFLYWTHRSLEKPVYLLLAALHCLIATGTRLVGICLLIYPFVLYLSSFGKQVFAPARFIRLIATSLVGALGIGLFFLYCHLKFGQWDLYFETGRIGWGISRSFKGIFLMQNYADMKLNGMDSKQTERALAFFTLIALPSSAASFGLDRWRRREGRKGFLWGLFGIAAGIWLITAAGCADRQFISYLRYFLPISAFLFPFLLSVLDGEEIFAKIAGKAFWKNLFLVLALLFAAVQAVYLVRFCERAWVA